MENFPTITITKFTTEKEVVGLAEDCKMCGRCCSYGSGFLAPKDFEKIAKHLGVSQEQLKKEFLEKATKFNTEAYRPKLLRKRGKPYGRCTFYNEKEGCTIHSIKPLHCKVTNLCSQHGRELEQWFSLNYLVNPADPESIRQWATYLKFNPAIPGGELNQLVKESLKLKKILSYKILK